MPDVGEFLYAWALTRPDLAALIGDADGTLRLEPLASTQAEGFPRVVYWKVDYPSVRSLAGLSGLAQPRYQLDFLSRSRGQALLAAALVRGNRSDPRLDGYKGTLGGVTVQACFCVDERDDQGAPLYAEDRGVVAVSQDWVIAFEDV